MNLALDTNILAYAEGVNGPERQKQALDLIARIPEGKGVVPAQVLGELFHVLVRKGGRTRETARKAILAWCDAFASAATDPAAMLLATELAATHNLGIWDAVILATASKSGCRFLLSEDMQSGFNWGGVTIVNPFVPTSSPLLNSLLRDIP
ncbi:MAG: PIN domain-containing protein [Alphaproteobacteria bacterium]|nr:PIN domain-containing protein [Alphaproteobacteria bacterium]